MRIRRVIARMQALPNPVGQRPTSRSTEQVPTHDEKSISLVSRYTVHAEFIFAMVCSWSNYSAIHHNSNSNIPTQFEIRASCYFISSNTSHEPLFFASNARDCRNISITIRELSVCFALTDFSRSLDNTHLCLLTVRTTLSQRTCVDRDSCNGCSSIKNKGESLGATSPCGHLTRGERFSRRCKYSRNYK